jgi:radical SAM protein with 4Fe4S-binding SPASM domain
MCLHSVKLATDDTLVSRELSDFEIRQLIPELAEIGCNSLHFSGGEPLMRKELEKFVKDASRNGIRTKLTTNGTLATEKRTQALARAKLRSVNVSLDGPSAAVHDKIRGVKGFYDRAIRGIQAFTTARESRGKPRVRINTVISHENCQYLDSLLDLASELKVDALHLLPVDFAHVDPSLSLTPDDYETIKEVISSYDRDTKLLGDVKLLKESFVHQRTGDYVITGQYALGYYKTHPCFAPFVHFFIMPEGDIYSCCIVHRSKENCLGNVRRQSVEETWNGPVFQELREKALTDPLYHVCHACDHFLEINREITKQTGIKGFYSNKME